MPRVYTKRSQVDTDDLNLQANMGTPPELDEAGFEADSIHVVGEKDFQDAAKVEAFMNEKIVVQIEGDAHNEHAPLFVQFGHNGISQYVKVGDEQVIKRKFLYSGLAAQVVRINCAFGKGSSGGEFNNVTPTASLTHRIRLVRDDNPQGGSQWVNRVMRELAPKRLSA